jgi:hypothetical protein
MADNMKEIFIEIGGQKRRIRYKYRGIEYAERELGSTFPQLLARFSNASGITAREWVVIVYAGLIQDNPDMSIEQVADDFDYGILTDWARGIAQAMRACMPEPGETNKKKSTRAAS